RSQVVFIRVQGSSSCNDTGWNVLSRVVAANYRGYPLMRVLFRTLLLAFSAALLIAVVYRPKPLEQQLVHLQLQQSIPHYAPEMAGEPVELQALMLMYAHDPVLLAKARLALMRYPAMAQQILLQFGELPTFQGVLKRYGEDVLLPIQYFLENEVRTLEIMHGMSETAKAVVSTLRGWWDGETAGETATGRLSPEDRGWYAVQFIDSEGYDFMGQFVLTQEGKVSWLQTERVLEGINRFFASGLKGLEARFRRDAVIAPSDVGWAAMDIAIGVGAFKLLRMGRVGTAGRSLTFSQRSAVLGAGLWRGTLMGARVVKYGAPAVLAYMALRHPSIINSVLAAAAERLGVPVKVMQLGGWTLLLFPVFLVLRWLIGPLAWLLAASANLLRWGEK